MIMQGAPGLKDPEFRKNSSDVPSDGTKPGLLLKKCIWKIGRNLGFHNRGSLQSLGIGHFR